jgi:hypothetical protein
VDYLRSIPFLLSNRFEAAPSWLMPALVAWTLPFLWAGITLTLRRALDAGWSAWTTMGFFLPVINYLLMVVLCLLPSSPGGSRQLDRARAYERRLPSALLAIGVGVLFGLGMVALAVTWLQRYGLALFFGTPFAIGAVTAFLFNRRYPASPRESTQVTLMTLALTTGSLFLLGSEGVRSPPPLLELTPLGDISPPHLDGYLRPRRGEFRLVALPGDRTRLEGSTWYELRLAPEPYWQLFSDYLIHRIHRRVLQHIKLEAEAERSSSLRPVLRASNKTVEVARSKGASVHATDQVVS